MVSILKKFIHPNSNNEIGTKDSKTSGPTTISKNSSSSSSSTNNKLVSSNSSLSNGSKNFSSSNNHKANPVNGRDNEQVDGNAKNVGHNTSTISNDTTNANTTTNSNNSHQNNTNRHGTEKNNGVNSGHVDLQKEEKNLNFDTTTTTSSATTSSTNASGVEKQTPMINYDDVRDKDEKNGNKNGSEIKDGDSYGNDNMDDKSHLDNDTVEDLINRQKNSHNININNNNNNNNSNNNNFTSTLTGPSSSQHEEDKKMDTMSSLENPGIKSQQGKSDNHRTTMDSGNYLAIHNGDKNDQNGQKVDDDSRPQSLGKESSSIEDMLKKDRCEIEKNMAKQGEFDHEHKGSNDISKDKTNVQGIDENKSSSNTVETTEHTKVHNKNPLKKDPEVKKPIGTNKPLLKQQQQEAKPVKKEKERKSFNPFSRLLKSSSSQVNLHSKNNNATSTTFNPALSGKSNTHHDHSFSQNRARGSTISMGQNYEMHPKNGKQVYPINTKFKVDSPSGESAPASALTQKPSTNIHPSKSLKSVSTHNTNPFMSSSNLLHNYSKNAGGKSNAATNHNSYNTSNNKMVYNPYGSISKTNTFNNDTHNNNNSSSNSLTPSGTANSLGFYLTDGIGESNLLPLPIENPNEVLPEKFKQPTVMFSDDFEPIKDGTSSIGKGASSDVRIVTNKHLCTFSKKKIYVLKKLCMFSKENPKDFYERCLKEFVIAKTLDGNKHIITTYLLMKIPTTTYMSRGWGFIMEYCDSGDLFNMIISPKWKKTGMAEKLCIFKQVAIGLQYIHSKGIAHKDIKPENILVTHEGVAKITDFGVSEMAWNNPNDPNSGVKLSNAYVGSPPYSSPEVMVFKGLNLREREKLTDKQYDPFKMDLWSLGVMFFTEMYQTLPFQSAEKIDPGYRDFLLSYSSFVSMNPRFEKDYHPAASLKSCISGPGGEYKLGKEFLDVNASRVAWKLCDPNPETRYSFEDLFSDPWFKNVQTCTIENGPEADADKHTQVEWTKMNEPLLIPPEDQYKTKPLTSPSSASLNRNDSVSSSKKPPLQNSSTFGSVSSDTPPRTPLEKVVGEKTTAPATPETIPEVPTNAQKHTKISNGSPATPDPKKPLSKKDSKAQLSQLLKDNPHPSPFAPSGSVNGLHSSDHSGGNLQNHNISRSSSIIQNSGSSSSSSSAAGPNPTVLHYISEYKEEKRKINIEYMNKKVSHNHFL